MRGSSHRRRWIGVVGLSLCLGLAGFASAADPAPKPDTAKPSAAKPKAAQSNTAEPGTAKPNAAKAPNTPETREALVEAGKYAEAFDAYRDALESDPKNPALLYNAGMMAYLVGKYDAAAESWSKLKAIEPEEWMVRAKLIQAFQALGKMKERDAEREGLYVLRRSSKDPEIAQREFYIRDQFVVDGKKVMAIEYFELKGDRAIRLSFDLVPAEGKIQTRYSLGSYKTTEDIAREMGELKPGQKLFHLDGYLEGGRVHQTFQFFQGEPSYDDVRKLVVEILEGKRQHRSGLLLPAK